MDFKKILPLLFVIALVGLFCVAAFNAMEQGDHRPSGLFETDYSEPHQLDTILYN